ncbi:MAG: RNA helicase [Pseudomonadales bacterium]|nr:RNA helicase [Pseudomonadales bacterium]
MTHISNQGKTSVTGETDVTATNDGGCSDYTAKSNRVTKVTGADIVPPAVMPDVERPCYFVLESNAKTKKGEYRKAGVYYLSSDVVDGVKVDIDEWYCGPLLVDAITRNGDQNSDYGRLLRFKNLDGHWITWAMPAWMMAGRNDPILAELLNQGLEISHHHRAKVIQYLASRHPKERVIAATSTGWVNPSLFIMPGKNIGEGNAVFQSDSPAADDYGQKGTLKGWQASLGRYCEGNPLLMLAVCASLAGPLLFHVRRSGGGINFYGKSSTGKTSAIEAASATWGNPETFKKTWRATSNGLEGIAAQHNDTTLILDELGQSSPFDVGNTVYMVDQGTGKTRANRSGATRKAKRWRVVLLSSGEIKLTTHMQEAGKRAKAGQEIRLLDVAANRTYGAWDHLHGLPDGRTFSDTIQKAARQHYGHAGPVFIEKLIQSGEADQLDTALAAITEQFPATTGQECRAAERFALAALAGELAIEWEILPTAPGSALEHIKSLYLEWAAERGTGPAEDTHIMQSITEFVERNGDALFSEVNDFEKPVRDRAGWWKDCDQGRVWYFTSEGLKRATTGHEIKHVLDALDSAGWIAERTADGKRRKVMKIGGRTLSLYAINAGVN